MENQKTVRIDDVTLQPGKLVQGRYKLAGLLGAGGFAKVFEAFDTNIERPVAIKFLDLHRSLADPKAAEEVLARFEREAKLAARIEHPNVVNIYDYGLLGSRQTVPFIVMERLSGHDLARVLAEEGPMSPVRALPLFADCLDALGKAHQGNIVHKDIKPSNLFVSNPGERDETLRLVDFGIAHIESAAEARLTRTGEMLGTAQYFAPEYINDQRVGPALDVYQMGLVLVEMLSGRPVVDMDNSLLCMHAHSNGELEVPVGLLDSSLGPVLRKALAHDDAKRYADGYAFADALREVNASSIPPVRAHALVCRLSAQGDSSEIVGARSTEDFDSPTQPATPSAAKAIEESPTVNLPTDVSASAPQASARELTDRGTLLLIAALLALLVLAGGLGALALAGGDGNADPADETNEASAKDEQQSGAGDTEAAEKTPAETIAAPKEPAPQRVDRPAPANESAPAPKSNRTRPAERGPSKKERERQKEERRRDEERKKLERKMKKRLEKKIEKEAEKSLERLGF